MAEFALGLTKTAVAGTVSRVKSAIEEETKLRVRVEDDLVFITGEFEVMQSFLNIAKAERTNNQVVRTWVRQLRDLAFDVEDCVEFVVHLDKASRWDWVRRLTSPLICMARPPLPLDVAVMEIKNLKARVEEVSQRNARYNLISNDSDSTPFTNDVSSPTLELMPDTGIAASAFHILKEVWEAAGKKRGTGDLKELITGQGSDLQVISVWGSSSTTAGISADHGVTHIIREAYKDPQICQDFKCRAWIKLMHPFNLDEFLENLLTQFYTSSCQQADVAGVVNFRKKMKSAVVMEDELMQQLSQQRYLLILEQLSSLVEWDAIRMHLKPDSKNGSRIVVATQQLGLALSCIGKPYLVSELSRGQSLCAFFNKVPCRCSDWGDFIWQLRRHGTFSVWGLDDGESSLVDKVYTCIIHKSKEFDGVEFQRHNWVNVPDPFDLNVFCWRLFLNFHSVGLRAEEIAAVGMMGYSTIIQECCRFLREDDCLVVINGLKLTDDWKLIKDNLLSEPTKGSIIVITEEESVAMYCADEKDRALSVQDLEADAVLRHSIKDFQYYVTGGKEEGRFFSIRRNRARDWTDKFGAAEKFGGAVHYRWLAETILGYLKYPVVVSLWGPAGAGISGLVRRLYYQHLLGHGDLEFTAFSWVDVVYPFNLTNFSWELLLDFHSDDPEAKQNAALGMIKGQDQVAECRKFLCEHNCLVVINGLHSVDDWDCIKDVFLSRSTNISIVVIMKAVCSEDEDEDDEQGLPPLIKVHHNYSYEKEEGSLRGVFSNRMERARDWMDKIEHGVHLKEREELILFLQKPGVISVWGIAGVGTSSFIKSLYYYRMLGLRHEYTSFLLGYCEEEFTMFSWVHVPHPFSLKEFSRCLLLDFLSDDPEAKENATIGMMEGHDLIEQCRTFLHQHKSFVVIDALQSRHDWDLIKAAFLSKPIKGCIVVNTYEASVAAHCAPLVVNVKGLEPDVALHLFRKIAWGGKQLSPEEVKVSKLTVAKCGGLPKVITAIGQYFDSSGRFGISRSELEYINADFMGYLEKDPGFDNLRGLFSWMQSYFDACSDSLKPCIFYLSVFPADHKSIRLRRLVRRWIAEGYSRDKIGSTAEEDGENLFSELVKLSIIQHSLSEVDKVCQVNGFFCEYIISRPMEDNLVFALDGRCSPNSQRAGQHLTISSSWDREEIVYESIDFTRLRSLTVFGQWMSFFVSDNMRLLRVLDLEDTSGLTNDDLEKIGKKLHRLKFLSLRGCGKITRLPDSLFEMRQLQTLDLKHTSIVTLPANITKLQRLQYICAGSTMPSTGEAEDATVAAAAAPPEDNADSTVAAEAPPEAEGDGMILSVPAAAHDTLTPEADGDGMVPSVPTPATPPLDQDGDAPESWSGRTRDILSTWFSYVNKLRRRQSEIKNGGVEFVPAAARGVGKLRALHTLGVINARGAAGKVFLGELKKLTQLRKLRLSSISRKNWQDFCFAISGHGYLESLSVRLDADQHDHVCILDDISKPLKALKILKLYGGNVHASPVWMKQLDGLTKAHIEDVELTISTQEEIDSLIEVPCQDMFRHLCVKPIQDGELRYGRWVNGWNGEQFKAAKILKIDCGSHRSVIVFGNWIPEYVEVLEVHCSSTEASLKLSGLDDHVHHLKEVWLKGAYSEAVKQHLQDEVDRYNRWKVTGLTKFVPTDLC